MESFSWRDNLDGESGQGCYVARMERVEATLLAQLVTEITVVLGGHSDEEEWGMVEAASTLSRPQERSLSFLLPDMSSDEEDGRRLRALTEEGLRSEKVERLRHLYSDFDRIACGEEESGEICLSPDEVWQWLPALNDLRLGVAGELGIQNEEDARRIEENLISDKSDQQVRLVSSLYMLLTWWQDSLLEAVAGGR